jgi:DNA-binding NarL/FixJ family response regulator
MQEVARGGTVLDPRMVNILMAKRTARTSTINELTPREREVLELVASGLSNNAIGEQLHIGGSAVEKHIRSMFLKLGLDPDDSRYHRRVLAVLEYFHLAGQMPSERGG